jgi:hypothetical protein
MRSGRAFSLAMKGKEKVITRKREKYSKDLVAPFE